MFNTVLHSSEKHVIGSRNCGLFSNFVGVLNHLDWCLRNNKVPVVYWDERSPYYVTEGYNGTLNAWEYYFEPVSHFFWEEGDKVDCNFIAPDRYRITTYPRSRITDPQLVYKKLIKPFIQLNSIVQNKVDTFFNTHIKGKHTIGIHLRGTDRSSEFIGVPELILQEAQRHAKPDSQFFIATDDNRLLELAKEILPGHVICSNSHRAYNNQPIHFNGPYHRATIGEEVIIDTYLLSSCDMFIHTYSNVSTVVLFLNPTIKNKLVLNDTATYNKP